MSYDDERANNERLLAALEKALLRAEKRIDGNVDVSQEKKLHRKYGKLYSEVSDLRFLLATGQAPKGGWS